jgi:hypothetical protein
VIKSRDLAGDAVIAVQRPYEDDMTQCKNLTSCSFFNEIILDTPAIAEMMKRRFCFGHSSECARIIVSSTLGDQAVPKELAPNDRRGAERILATEGIDLNAMI